VLGLRDLIAEGAVLLIEWPERGAGVLPAPDWRICLTHADSRRELSIEASSPRGEELLPAAGET
jgi:tRNA threonylcarbamoyladenosine biosynthesis protein TsaE